ncbi:MAG: hypothetical protein KGZ25_00360 [Planctomycetes bacterium]|nr:hypothetical protein [Planctomycetota bacterium]
MTAIIAPPVDNFRVNDETEDLTLRWEHPRGEYEGYILFSGTGTDALHQVDRLSDDQTSYVIPSRSTASVYAIVTYQGARVSEYSFASPAGEEAGTAMKEAEAPQEQSEPINVSADTEIEDARCLECDGELSWVDVEEQDRTRRMLRCDQCGKRHVRSGDGRILMVEQLHYGCCRCPECEEVHALAMSSDDLIICSETGRLHAWQGDAGEVDLAELG